MNMVVDFSKYIDVYEHLYKMLYNAVNLSIKYNITYATNTIEEIIILLKQVKSNGAETLTDLLNELS